MAPSVMPKRKVLDLPVSVILTRNRLRAVIGAAVDAKAVSMEESGQITPVVVRSIPGEEGEQLYEVVAGAHRLAAARKLGWSTIECDLRILSDAEARLIEIDENLCGPDLTPLQRAVFIAARFDAWRQRFPERVAVDAAGQAQPKRGAPFNSAKLAELNPTGVRGRGRPKNSDKMSGFLKGAPAGMGFREETATEIGISPRTVANAFAVFQGLAPALRSRLDGTWVGEKEALLRQLASVGEPVEQSAIADVLLDGRAKTFSDARAIAAGNPPAGKAQTPADETIKAFRKVWGSASPSARALILAELQGKKLPAGWSVAGPEDR